MAHDRCEAIIELVHDASSVPSQEKISAQLSADMSGRRGRAT
jgi:hypothetical protein